MKTDEFNAQPAPNIQSLLFRIVQEALTNCAKHAQGGHDTRRADETLPHASR